MAPFAMSAVAGGNSVVPPGRDYQTREIGHRLYLSAFDVGHSAAYMDIFECGIKSHTRQNSCIAGGVPSEIRM